MPTITPLEIILKQNNTLTERVFNNSVVPIQFEAKADTVSNELHLTETKSKDGHLFTFKHEKNPPCHVSVNYKTDGVHFSTQHTDNQSLFILSCLIKAHERALETLELQTDWKIKAQNMTIGFKAVAIMYECGANFDNLIDVQITEGFPVNNRNQSKVTAIHAVSDNKAKPKS